MPTCFGVAMAVSVLHIAVLLLGACDCRSTPGVDKPELGLQLARYPKPRAPRSPADQDYWGAIANTREQQLGRSTAKRIHKLKTLAANANFQDAAMTVLENLVQNRRMREAVTKLVRELVSDWLGLGGSKPPHQKPQESTEEDEHEEETGDLVIPVTSTLPSSPASPGVSQTETA